MSPFNLTMSSPVVLITGCSSGGIGDALCHEYSRQGCTVYATARTLGSLVGLPPGVYKLVLDVTSPLPSIQAVIDRVNSSLAAPPWLILLEVLCQGSWVWWCY